ncbi:MAG: hypothetical protein LKE53_10455 [Oscillospiraceae bacterium]|jgi:hypothetical protein|nr:hypothetical protein [Oscillospiraceae bacterium]MDD3260985.1 hypothetical protein [Oscillospiraceae bacterium]
MSKNPACCPWCGAHFSLAERLRAKQEKTDSCPFCGKKTMACRSKKRLVLFWLLFAGMCAADFFLLVFGVPILAVWLLTAAFAAALWFLRGWTVVFRKNLS